MKHVGLVLMLCLFAFPVLAESPGYPYPLKPHLSGQLLPEVPAQPFAGFPVDNRPYFDFFMWQNFIALMWPSVPDSHGKPFRPDDPAAFGHYIDGRQPVWLGFKTANDLFLQNGDSPVGWEQPNGAAACRNLEHQGRSVLMTGSKMGTIADEINQAFGGPLPDQTGLFTRYEVRVNRVLYDYVRQHGYYNKANWPASGKITLPASSFGQGPGVLEVKAAWRDLAKVPAPYRQRFFQLEALATVPGTCGTNELSQMLVCDCQPIVAGLVGFHIAQKTPNFPQWVWATFEQVDNLGEDLSTPAGMQASYYDPELYKRVPGITRANPAAHPGSSRVPAADDFNPEPINVLRLSAIPDTPRPPAGQPDMSTTGLNQQYRQLMQGTVWQHYQLIGTQWPTLPSASPPNPTNDDFGCEDGTPAQAGGMPFPACQLANVTMETYHQYDSCMNCHQGAQRAGADFSWILALRAWVKPKQASQAD
ncbi:hypothetical protein [Alkalimonas sp.]|uniref:hypothetical protein n=1 Tax=Alkalimonas sp. TaxID=1872453 RepID=UPI00263BA5AA|nr:hypothetical protein [Alkalimonas sp.]MCC5826543.1 hypothetical protein [Alkalimonas sp.]